MNLSLATDPSKDTVIYINDFYSEFAEAFTKLSERLNRPLRGILLIDAERKASGKNLPDKEGLFEEIIVDFTNDAALKRAIKPFEDRLLIVSCDSERSQLYFKRIIPHVPYINTTTEGSIVFCTHKGKMREILCAYDSTIAPKAVVVENALPKSVNSIIETLKFPLIIKPTNLSASRLVNKVSSEDELREILNTSFISLNEIYSSHRGLGDKTMVVEEFVEGDLFSVDAYVNNSGKVYVLPFIHFQNTSQAGLEGYQLYQEETYLALDDEEFKKGARIAEAAIRAVGLRSSVVHIELFYTTNGWKIIELGARPGDWRQEFYEISYGIDHALNELLIKIGLEPEMPSGLIEYSAGFYIDAPKAGIVDSIDGIEEARNHPQVSKMRVHVGPGDKVSPSSKGGDLIIEVLVRGQDYDQLKRNIDMLRASIKVNLK